MRCEANDDRGPATVQKTASLKYTYQPLKTHNTIRLIDLLPCEDSDPDQSLKCNLTVVSLSDNPSFVALSYTWGENVFPEKLLCDDCALGITANLHAALVRLRLPDQPLKIWVDAVCINQTDDDEKTHQIPLMASIYGQATEVLIWLGEASEDSGDVMNYLKRIGQRFVDRGGPVNEPRDERSPENDLIWADVTGDPNLENTAVIWTRPWFSRRWIIQEVALAQRATVYCGTVSMDWDVLFHANKAVFRLASDGGQYWNKETKKIRKLEASTTMNMWKLNEIRDQIWTNPQSTKRRIHDLLDHARAFDCRDAKDRVFALLAIFNRGRATPLEIDYSKSEAEVYIAFARYCLQNDITIDILSLAGTANHSFIPDSLNLPSWVPDWRFPFRSATDTLNGFDAGYRLASSISLLPSPESRELLARGIIVDKIAAFVYPISAFHEPGVPSPFILSRPETFMKPAHIATWYVQVEAVFCHVFKISYPTPRPYIGGGDIWEALARTLIIDRNDVIFDWPRDRPKNADATSHPLYEEWKGFSNHMLKCAQEAREGKKENEEEKSKLTVITYEQMEYHIRPPRLCEDRCFFITQRGYIGLGPKDMRGGDLVVVLAGSGVPHVVRPESGDGFILFGDLGWLLIKLRTEAVLQMPDGQRRPYILRDREERYSLVGEAYVQGLMNDEVWDLKGVFFEDLKIV